MLVKTICPVLCSLHHLHKFATTIEFLLTFVVDIFCYCFSDKTMEQYNTATAFLDGSVIYGTNEVRENVKKTQF